VELCIAAARIGTFVWDLASGRLTADELLLELFGFDADTFGSTIEALNSPAHPQDRTRVAGVPGTAINECGDYIVEYRITLPSNGDRGICSRVGRCAMRTRRLRGDGPTEILRKVDRVMQTLQVGATATAVVARLEQTAEEASRCLTRVCPSNAGHPPPVALDGRRHRARAGPRSARSDAGSGPRHPTPGVTADPPARRHRAAVHRRQARWTGRRSGSRSI
jgi:hypothetical protein